MPIMQLIIMARFWGKIVGQGGRRRYDHALNPSGSGKLCLHRANIKHLER